MLVSESEVQVDIVYTGPGNGCRHVLRFDAIGFVKELDCRDYHESTKLAIREIDVLIFNAFIAGDYQFKPPGRHQQAVACVALPSLDLIERLYEEDRFIAEIVRHELIRRELWEIDLHRIGEFGNDLAKSQTIQILKSRCETSQRP